MPSTTIMLIEKNCTMQKLKIKFYLVDKIKDLSPEDSL